MGSGHISLEYQFQLKFQHCHSFLFLFKFLKIFRSMVGRKTGFWSTRYGFESQSLPIFILHHYDFQNYFFFHLTIRQPAVRRIESFSEPLFFFQLSLRCLILCVLKYRVCSIFFRVFWQYGSCLPKTLPFIAKWNTQPFLKFMRKILKFS